MWISAEIPNELCNPEYYKAVEEFMTHGPCGLARKNSPCMVNGRYSKFFPKKFVPNSMLDRDGYPIYRRRDNGHTIKKNDIDLDNRYVVHTTDLVLTDTQKKNYALLEIEKLLHACNKLLGDYPPMPIPDGLTNSFFGNQLLYEELAYDQQALKEEHDILVGKLTEEQLVIYSKVMFDVDNNKGGLFFVYGYGGTGLPGKPFMENNVCCFTVKGKIVLNVASSGIASLLLPGGRTAHSRFAIPISINEDSTCNIKQGDSKLGDNSDGECNIIIPSQFVLQSKGDPIKEIVEHTFPLYGTGNIDPEQLKSRAILAPTLDVVDHVNEYMNNMNQTSSKTYLSCDSVCKANTNANILAEVHTTEFLNSLRCSAVPNHSISLKVGSPIMLLRNIDHSIGLCNGTRLIVSKLGNHVIEAKILCGTHYGKNVLISQLALTPSDPRLPFKFQKKQFPVMLSYAMTINQRQTLSQVGLLLKKPVFNHGQLYVAVSCVSNPDGLKILISDESKGLLKCTQNVVYKELFNNL
ncbi:uncharacterized protein LOC116005811 [Ipomoea triloba]|uniref:uncharacterized protein LOC116005811 n=1 Tax=Ipomoea triloba TaxID=35885 RepID=UPI00125E7A98|nr:uncharacterized protein LOC116005811 [Ipomoea triloba]